MKKLGRPPKPDSEKFWKNVDKEGPFPDPEKYPSVLGRCWSWGASKDRNGYGRFHKTEEGGLVAIKAHRWSFESWNGKVPTGMCVLHHCDNPSCVNPGHLFVGTFRDNSDDKIKKKRHYHGESVNTAKLNEIQVRVARRMRELGMSFQRIGDFFGVTKQSTISLVKRRTWRHV